MRICFYDNSDIGLDLNNGMIWGLGFEDLNLGLGIRIEIGIRHRGLG